MSPGPAASQRSDDCDLRRRPRPGATPSPSAGHLSSAFVGSTVGSTFPGRLGVRSAGSLLAVLVVVVGLLLVGCGSGQVSGAGEAAPGFSNQQREVTDDPFEIARPTSTSGPTTIPGPGPTLFLPDGAVRPATSTTAVASEVSTTTTTTVPTTTTTLPLFVARPATSDRICAGFYPAADALKKGQLQLRSNEQLVDDPAFFESFRTQWFDAVGTGRRELLGASLGPELALASALSRRLGFSTEVAATVRAFSTANSIVWALSVSPPAPGETAGWPEIEAHLIRTCPNLIRDLTGRDTFN